MTAKAAWLDEAGQKEFKQESWEEIQQRVSIDLGRILITTTVYSLGWLKQKIYDPWRAADGNHPLYDVIQFSSTMNPAFPVEEYERGRRELPAWKFHQKFDGQFAKPIGLIYDCFDDTIHKVPRFPIPAHWRRHVGLDFGGVNTAAVFFAEDPATQKLYAYREYKAGGRTAAEHAAQIKQGEPPFATVVGGSKSEGQWRQEFTAGGLAVREPDQPEVEVGIDRVYGAIKSGKLFVFSTQMDGLLEELGTYSRELDEAGEPTEKIERQRDVPSPRRGALHPELSVPSADEPVPSRETAPPASATKYQCSCRRRGQASQTLGDSVVSLIFRTLGRDARLLVTNRRPAPGLYAALGLWIRSASFSSPRLP